MTPLKKYILCEPMVDESRFIVPGQKDLSDLGKIIEVGDEVGDNALKKGVKIMCKKHSVTTINHNGKEMFVVNEDSVLLLI